MGWDSGGRSLPAFLQSAAELVDFLARGSGLTAFVAKTLKIAKNVGWTHYLKAMKLCFGPQEVHSAV